MITINLYALHFANTPRTQLPDANSHHFAMRLRKRASDKSQFDQISATRDASKSYVIFKRQENTRSQHIVLLARFTKLCTIIYLSLRRSIGHLHTIGDFLTALPRFDRARRGHHCVRPN
jgi:hypothetical protein